MNKKPAINNQNDLNQSGRDLLNKINNLKPIGSAKQRMYGPLAVILITIFAYIFSQILAYIIFGLYYSYRGQGSLESAMNNINTQDQFVLFLLIESITLLIIYAFLKRRKLTFKDIGLGAFKGSYIGRAVIVFLIYFGVLIFVTGLLGQLTSINTEQEQQIGFDHATGTAQLVMVFLSLAILPPLAEEILMRGFLYTGLRKRLSVVRSTLIVSILFGVLHLQLGSGAPPLWTAAIDTFILSLFLCYLREKTGSIWAGIIVHFLKNSLAFLFLFVIKTGGM